MNNTTNQSPPSQLHAGFLTSVPGEEQMNYLEDHDDFEHGITGYEFPSDTALQVAKSRVSCLESDPLTAYILTNDQHDFMLAMQHWFSKNYFVGDTSAIVCRPDLQSAQLFKRLM